MELKLLNQGNDIQTRLSEKRKLLRMYENGKISSITIVTFNEETGLNELHTECANIPRNKFKVIAIEVLRAEIDNLIHQFGNIGTPRPNQDYDGN